MIDRDFLRGFIKLCAFSLAASGARYDMTQLFRFGSELKYDVHERSGAVIPQIWFAFPHEITLKAGFSAGFDRNHENFMRLVIEVEF